MRDIIFRGKRIDNGEWVYGSAFFGAEDSCKIIYALALHPDFVYEGNVFYSDAFSVDPSTVGQYTGLTDKNGVKIFDGDIISVKNENNGEIFRFEVKFGKCGGAHNVEHDVGYIGFYFQPIAKRGEEEYMLRKDPIYWLSAYKCEVIGNIYDNKELLNDT